MHPISQAIDEMVCAVNVLIVDKFVNMYVNKKTIFSEFLSVFKKMGI